jgi:hypothetical protein
MTHPLERARLEAQRTKARYAAYVRHAFETRHDPLIAINPATTPTARRQEVRYQLGRYAAACRELDAIERVRAIVQAAEWADRAAQAIQDYQPSADSVEPTGLLRLLQDSGRAQEALQRAVRMPERKRR